MDAGAQALTNGLPKLKMVLFPSEVRAYLEVTDGKDVLWPDLRYDESNVEKLCRGCLSPTAWKGQWL